jgi:hypothetical protein
MHFQKTTTKRKKITIHNTQQNQHRIEANQQKEKVKSQFKIPQMLPKVLFLKKYRKTIKVFIPYNSDNYLTMSDRSHEVYCFGAHHKHRRA